MTYPANEQRPAAQFCPHCGGHVPRIAELEKALHTIFIGKLTWAEIEKIAADALRTAS